MDECPQVEAAGSIRSDVITVLDDLLDNAIAVMDADFGNIQLLSRKDNKLRIVVNRGFERPFLDFFAVVDALDSSACAFALRASGRVIVKNIDTSPFLSGNGAVRFCATPWYAQSIYAAHSLRRELNGHDLDSLAQAFYPERRGVAAARFPDCRFNDEFAPRV